MNFYSQLFENNGGVIRKTLLKKYFALWQNIVGKLMQIQVKREKEV